MKTIYTFSFRSILLTLISTNLSSQTALPPTPDFSVTQDTVCVGEAVQFSDMSSNNPTTWSWNFSGGSPVTSTLQNPVIVYYLPGKYNVVLNVSNSQGAQSKGKLNVVTVVECTGIFEYDEMGFKVFPNPVQSHIKLSGSSDAKYTLYNTIGVVLATGRVKAGEETSIQLNDLPSGIYILNMQNGARTKSIRIIKE
jgi:PKD repeat protein